MLTGYLGDALTLAFTVEGPDGPLDYTGLTVKAALIDAAGTVLLAPSVVCSPTAPGATPAKGAAVAVWTNGTYPNLTLGQCLLQVSVTTGGNKVTWPEVPVRIRQGFT